MNRSISLFATLIILMTNVHADPQKFNDYHGDDSAGEGHYEKLTINLPSRANENQLKLLLHPMIVRQSTNACDAGNYSGSLIHPPWGGSGENEYLLHINGTPPMAGTMPCAPAINQPHEFRVTGNFQIPYDSQNPIIIFAPKNCIVTYSVVRN